MRETLKALEELQKIDQQISELVRGVAEHPQRVAQLEVELEEGLAAIEAERQSLATLEKQKKETEDQLAADREKVKKWEARLTEQRSTREYTALAREIDIAKKQNTSAGETIAELAKQVAAAAEALEESEAGFADREHELRREMRRLRSAITRQGNERKRLEETRAEAGKDIRPALLKRYDAVLKRRNNALVQVVNGACCGCHMNVPPQLNNQLRSHAKIDVCPSCHRMIYAAEAFETEAEAAAAE